MEIKEITEAGVKSRPSNDAFEYRPSPHSPIFSNFNRQNSIAKRDSRRDSGRLSIASTDRGTQTAEPLQMPTFEGSPKESGSRSPITKTSQNLADDADEGEPVHGLDSHEEVTPEMPIIQKAKVVTIPKRIPPALPPRNPYRNSRSKSASVDLPTSPLAQDHEESGLGINLNGPADDQIDGGNEASLPEGQGGLEDQLNKVHLAPERDFEKLSPSKDGFDEVSMSGSDYSRTPAETPIRMEDNEASGGLAVGTGRESEGPIKAIGNDDEVFHSIPSTPLEASYPGAWKSG